MPLYNVEVIRRTVMVVEAEDEDNAWDVAKDNYEQGFDDDCMSFPTLNIIGKVESKDDLIEGWDVNCVPYPYGTDSIEEILKGE